jgi:hypothetical protein
VILDSALGRLKDGSRSSDGPSQTVTGVTEIDRSLEPTFDVVLLSEDLESLRYANVGDVYAGTAGSKLTIDFIPPFVAPFYAGKLGGVWYD